MNLVSFDLARCMSILIIQFKMRKIVLNFFLCIGLSLYGQNTESKFVQVIDQQTKEPVSFATVLIKNTTKGTISNRQGFFKVLESNSNDVIVVSCIGYKTKEFEREELPNMIFLDQATNLIETVVVSAGRKRELKKDIPVAMSAVSMVEMENSKPSFGR